MSARLHEADPHWRDRAACAGAEPEQFLPERPRIGRQIAMPDLEALAWRYCHGCPVRDECGTAADHHQDVGLRGGAYRWRDMSRRSGYYRRLDLLRLPLDDQEMAS